jgi:tetratricopeptide (TPR) repeat protein
LIPSPNPISDNSGNLTITGNVSGGSYFHGPVPYRSTTAFGAPLGSTSLDSFLRGSAQLDDFDRYIEGYRAQPYYSPTGTVTTTTPGRSGVFAPSTTRIAERAPDTFGLENVPKKEISPRQGVSTSESLSLPVGRQEQGLPTPLSSQRFGLGLTAEGQVEKLGSEEIAAPDRNIRGERLTSEQYQQQMEQLRRELQRIKDKTNELTQRLEEKDESLQVPTKVETGEGVRQLPLLAPQEARGEEPGLAETNILAPQEQTEEAPALTPTELAQKQGQQDMVPSAGKERVWGPETYERMKRQFDNLQASQVKKKTSVITKKDSELAYGELAATRQYKESAAGEEQSSDEVFREGQSGTEDTYSEMPRTMGLEETSGKTKETSALEEVTQLSPTQLSAEAKRIMGPHKDIGSFSEAKFNEYMLAAQTYLKQGKYYRAADTYALASIYKKDEPAAYVGRGHALFAAGEYMSSALFIARAIEISAAYAKAKVDLVTLLGDIDKLESRIADVEEWFRKSSSAEIGFLLGYVYYQTGRLDQAKEAINIAYEKKPQWPAVQVLKKAIDEAIGSSK